MKSTSMFCAAAIAAAATIAASAGTLPYGTYQLANHPDGNIAPPLYGLRLDGLFNATQQTDRFTFDFDHALSDMVMSVTNNGSADIITISGESYGGRDIGSGYAADQWAGVYEIFFQYTILVGLVNNDDDRHVAAAAEMLNFGYIIAPNSQQANLADKASGASTFRLGDEGNDQGHRGFGGVSGWGWLAIEQSDGSYFRSPEGGSDDWLFTVVIPLPGPALMAMAGLGGLVTMRRRPMA